MKKRGPQRDSYPRQEFSIQASSRRKFLKIGIRTLAARLGINRGSLSEILNGNRFCPLEQRQAILTELGFSAKEQEPFCGPVTPVKSKDHFAFPQPYAADTILHLDCGLDHLLRAEYEEALQHFGFVLQSPEAKKNLVLAADANWRISWVHFERGEMAKCEERVKTCLQHFTRLYQASLDKILSSIQPGSHSAILSARNHATLVLWSALHIRCKLLAERLVYLKHHDLERYNLEQAFVQAEALAQFIDHPIVLGHDHRWQAVFHASLFGKRNLPKAKRLLDASLSAFTYDGIGKAYLERDKGVVLWHAEDFPEARKRLYSGLEQLAHFDDLRAMGPAFCALSEIAEQTKDRQDKVRRFALAGGVIHPYFFSYRAARRLYLGADEDQRRRDERDLLAGYGAFGGVKEVWERILKSQNKAEQRMRENFQKILEPSQFGMI